jgi:hypothetical protein
VSQKLVRALARPLKVGLDLRPVISRLEKGAELSGGTPFGAPRMKLEGRWISNQNHRLPGLVQDTSRRSRLGLSPCFMMNEAGTS